MGYANLVQLVEIGTRLVQLVESGTDFAQLVFGVANLVLLVFDVGNNFERVVCVGNFGQLDVETFASMVLELFAFCVHFPVCGVAIQSLDMDVLL